MHNTVIQACKAEIANKIFFSSDDANNNDFYYLFFARLSATVFPINQRPSPLIQSSAWLPLALEMAHFDCKRILYYFLTD